MALLFMDSFDGGDYAVKYPSYAPNRVNVTTTTRFSSGRSLQINKDIAGQGWVKKYIAPTSETYVGVAIMQTNLDGMLFRLWGDSAATAHLYIYTKANGSLDVQRGSTSIATTSMGLVAANKWYFIEVKAVIHSTTGSFVMRLNGQEVINFTGNTKNGGTANTIDCVEMVRSNQDGSNHYDDLYICDNTGPAPYNTFLNEVRLHALTPNAAGSSTQFTPSSGANYAAVDELPYSATDYVSSGTSGQRDTYQLTDIPANSGNILAVQNNIIAKKTDAANIALKSAIKSGASVYYGADTFLGGSDGIVTDTRTSDPATGGAWTSSGVNSLEAGFEVV